MTPSEAGQMAKLNNREREWVELRQRYKLSHAEVQMGRELEIVPRSLAKISDVAAHLRALYLDRFGRDQPETVLSVEERAKLEQREKAIKKLHPVKPEQPETPPPAPQKRKKNRPHVSVPPRPPKR
jgi:hypothetical protein